VTDNRCLHTLPIRIYYEDTDAGGVVYYANYLRFFERARTECLRSLGHEQQQMAAQTGCLFVVRQASLNYRAPARLDDELLIVSSLQRIGRATVTFEQRCERNGSLLVEGSIEIACVDKDTFRPRPLPAALKQDLESSQSSLS